MSDLPLLGAIEAGGTKFIVAVGTGPDDVRDIARIDTTTPAETLAAVVSHLENCQAAHGKLAAIGVGTFGPAGVNPAAADFGYITTTPKPGWAHTDFLAPLRARFDVPMAFDTDVNAAGLGEWLWGAGRGCDAVLYLTIGTGIGGGFVLEGRPLHGLLHPEMGHIRIPRDPSRDPFTGACPWHGDCLEGLASGPAIEKRWGCKAGDLAPDHAAWPLQAHYLALAVSNFLCTLSPQRIILGGGVMDQTQLWPLLHQEIQQILNGYLQHEAILSGISSLVVPPGLSNRSGLLGAMALAHRALTA